MNTDSFWLAQGTGPSPVLPASLAGRLAAWRALDDSAWRVYAHGEPPPVAGLQWRALTLLLDVPGAAPTGIASHHFVVETGVADQNLEEFTAWYNTEHAPGLARVPGTIRARRFALPGSPTRFLACYDLRELAAFERPEWLAVRGSPWSDRVRPMFQGPIRTMHQAIPFAKA